MSSIWTKLTNLTGISRNDQYGHDLEYSGDGTVLAIGSPKSDRSDPQLTDSGHVAVYTNNGDNSQWIQLGQNIYGSNSFDEFGKSLSLSKDGKILAIGAPNSSDEIGNIKPGQVKVYEFVDQTWKPKGDTFLGQNNHQSLGFSVALSSDGKTLAIGDPDHDSNGNVDNGLVDVYGFNNGSQKWTQIGSSINGLFSKSNFGYSIDLSSDGKILAIGSPEIDIENKNGRTSIYQLVDNNWIKLGNDIVGEENTDEAGGSVSIATPTIGNVDGTIIAIGAQKNDGTNLINSGHVRVYKYANSQWNKHGEDIDGKALGDLSSSDIELSANGQYLAIGSINHDHQSKENSGQVRIFDFDQNSNIWRQSGFDIVGSNVAEELGSSVSFVDDGSKIAIGSNFGGVNKTGQVSIFKHAEHTYPVDQISYDTNNALVRYKYSLYEAGQYENGGSAVKGVNLWSKDSNGNTQFDSQANTKYDLIVEAKTTTQVSDWNLETYDLTLSLADNLFTNWNTANIDFGNDAKIATSSKKLDSTYFNSSEDKEGVRVTAAALHNLNGTNAINSTDYKKLFKIKDLTFNQNLQRGTSTGETLGIQIKTNIYDTVVSNYQDTDNNGLIDNAFIGSLSDLGFDENDNGVEIDRSDEIYAYETYSELVNHGTTLWAQREVGSNGKSFLVRQGSTVDARSWWSNVGNIETQLKSMIFSNIYSWTEGGIAKSGTQSVYESFVSNNGGYSTGENFASHLAKSTNLLDTGNLQLINFTTPKNVKEAGENTVGGYSVNAIATDGTPNSWTDTSESISVDLKVKISDRSVVGQAISSESFFSVIGDDFKDNNSFSNNKNLISKNIVTYKGDVNYDGRVSLIDLAYLNAGKLKAGRSEIAPEDVDVNFDGKISIADIEALSPDFLKSIHKEIDHHSNWEKTSWSIPGQLDPEKENLNVGNILENDTALIFDNSSFIAQQFIEDNIGQTSLNIPLSEENN